jgi:hypothetical protein
MAGPIELREKTLECCFLVRRFKEESEARACLSVADVERSQHQTDCEARLSIS